ncbi:MAG TPA: class I SAM-dependent methyltransferase [Rhodospirillales bacterium]|nr:class I SAM-dependent methyltransferase [Rhodospirillales bacterium]
MAGCEAREEHWQRVWSEKDAERVSWYEAVPVTSLALIEEGGPAADTPILDVGGGASTLVDHLLDRGYRDVTVLDIAPAAFAPARRRLAERAAAVHWEVADVTRWQPPRRYGLWHDRAVFHFLVAETERAAYRATLARALARDGLAIVATFAPDAPPKCSGLPVRRHDPEALAAAFAGILEPVSWRRHLHVTPGGVRQPFVYGLFRRR